MTVMLILKAVILELACTLNYKTTFDYFISQRNYGDWILLKLIVFHQFYLCL